MKSSLSIFLVGLSGALFAQALPPSEIPIERFYQYPLINGRSPSAPAMSADGSKIVFGWNMTGIRKLDLYVMDFPSGKSKRIVEAAKIDELPRQDDTRKEEEKTESALYDGGIGTAQWAPDGRELMFSYKGRTWLVEPDGKNLRPLFDGSSGIGGPQFTEDGNSISYTNGVNVFRMDRRTGFTKQLTFISKPNTSVDGYEFSPNGKFLAVQWSDSSKVGNHVMMDFSKDRATVVPIRRTWNSELSTDVQIGIVPANGGVIKFVPEIPRDIWTKNLSWSPDSTKVEVGWIKGDFMEYTISIVDPEKATKKDIYTEKSPSNYINDWREVVWSRDSKKLFFGTDILDGKFINRSLFKMDPDGKNIQALYKENTDIGSFMRPKNSDRIIMSTASRSPLTSEITIIEPDGKRKQHVIVENGYSVPKDFNSANLPLVSEDGKKIATVASTRKLNGELYSVEPTKKRLTVSQTELFKKVQWADFKEVTFPTADGRMIHGMLITKPGLDMTKKHPAFLSNIYADSAKANWGGWMENYAAMNLDMVVLCVDFRSSWGYDGEFNSGYYKKMGLVDVDEAVAAKKFLASQEYVRADRIGIWGWSYGGYLTCMSLLTKPGEFYAGVAVASVTDWKSYNEWYTRRRLGLVKDDKDKIFEKTSPITYASGLQDNLLLVHGMLDDNVLFQDTARLMQRLIENGKYFDIMAYPRDDHGMGKDTSRPHVQATILRYLYNKLMTP
jgi:dipeptidyl-peptidase 4